jgi:hydrogenase maturation protease
VTTLVLGLGNDLLADDGVGPQVIRLLRESPIPADADLVESALHGVALLDLFIGYDRAIVIDAIQTGRAVPGAILELDPADLDSVPTPSPHFTGLPELFSLARQMELKFPQEVRILAVEAADTSTVGGDLTPAVRDSLPDVCRRVRTQLERWRGQAAP